MPNSPGHILDLKAQPLERGHVAEAQHLRLACRAKVGSAVCWVWLFGIGHPGCVSISQATGRGRCLFCPRPCLFCCPVHAGPVQSMGSLRRQAGALRVPAHPVWMTDPIYLAFLYSSIALGNV